MRDRYHDFKNLKAHERSGKDFRITVRFGNTGIAILSIHGGEIEPGTTRIAQAIAGDDHTFYSFVGTKPKGNLGLHITSTRFDEPTALEIVRRSEIVISIHGCAETRALVFLGGLDDRLKERVQVELQSAGFEARLCSTPSLGGAHLANICNLCGRGMGVQLEISRGLRKRLFRDLTPEGRTHPTRDFFRFVRAVREAVAPMALVTVEGDPGTD